MNRVIANYLLFIAIFLLTARLNANGGQTEPGVFDLRDWDWATSPVVSLEGDWEFYWQQLLDPAQKNETSSPSYIKVPAPWSEASFDVEGFASYRAKILLDHVNKPYELSLTWGQIWTAARIYVNGKLVATQGVVGSNPQVAEPGGRVGQKSLIPIAAGTKTIEILIQVSNYDLFFGGMLNAPSIGVLPTLIRNQRIELAVGIFLVASLLVMGFYHIGLFWLRRKDPSPIHFAMLCFGVVIHMSSGNTGLIELVFPDWPFLWSVRFYNIGWMIAIVALVYYCYSLFPDDVSLRVARLVAWITTGFILYVLARSIRGFIYETWIYQGITAMIILYMSVTLAKCIKRKREGARFLSIAFGIVMLAVIHDMLAIRGLIATPAVGPASLLVFFMTQSYLLARRFSSAFERVEKSETKIRALSEELTKEWDQVIDLNLNLEKKVESKTRDIQAILRSIQLGIFALEGPEARIAKDYSTHLKVLFDQQDLAGQKGLDLLLERAELDNDLKDQILNTIKNAIGEDELAFQANAHLLPIEISERHTEDAKPHTWELSWSPMLDGSKLIEKILVTIRDVTDIRALQKDAKSKEEELEFIGEIVNVPNEAFQRFMRDSFHFLHENQKLLSQSSISNQDMEVLKVLFINMHTMKGAARSLYFKKMTNIFHEVEQYYAYLQSDSQRAWDLERMKQDLKEVESILSTYEKIAMTKLGRDVNEANYIRLPCNDLVDLQQRARRFLLQKKPLADGQSIIEAVDQAFSPYIYRPAQLIFEDIFSCTSLLARDLHKEAPHVVIRSNGVHLTADGERILRQIFIHLIRNSMDHGIESKSERQAKGKEPFGTLNLELKVSQDKLMIYFSDDGQGLMINRIRDLAISQGLMTPAMQLSDQQIARFIFHQGLSTAKSISDISGRGVGMDAVRTFLAQHGGEIDIEIESKSAEGFCRCRFMMTIPEHFWTLEITYQKAG